MLPLAEVFGFAIPFIIILLLIVVGVYGAFPLIGVVERVEVARLHAHLEFPTVGAPQGHDIARSDAGTPAFAFPSALFVEADVI